MSGGAVGLVVSSLAALFGMVESGIGTSFVVSSVVVSVVVSVGRADVAPVVACAARGDDRQHHHTRHRPCSAHQWLCAPADCGASPYVCVAISDGDRSAEILTQTRIGGPQATRRRRWRSVRATNAGRSVTSSHVYSYTRRPMSCSSLRRWASLARSIGLRGRAVRDLHRRAGLLEQEVDPGDVATVPAVHHLRARSRETRPGGRSRETAVRASCDRPSRRSVGRRAGSPTGPSRAASPSRVASTSGDDEAEAHRTVDGRLDPSDVGTGVGEVDDRPGGRHRAKAVDHDEVDRSQHRRGVHGERQPACPPLARRLRSTVNSTASGVRAIEPVEGRRGLVAHPTPLAEAQQPETESVAVCLRTPRTA